MVCVKREKEMKYVHPLLCVKFVCYFCVSADSSAVCVLCVMCCMRDCVQNFEYYIHYILCYILLLSYIQCVLCFVLCMLQLNVSLHLHLLSVIVFLLCFYFWYMNISFCHLIDECYLLNNPFLYTALLRSSPSTDKHAFCYCLHCFRGSSRAHPAPCRSALFFLPLG